MSADHFLIVGPFDPDDDTDRFDVEHPATCPVEWLGPPAHRYYIHECGVGHYVECDGFDGYFVHADDPARESAYQERVPVGRHRIETWSETHPGGPWGPTEWSGGLRLIEAAS